MFGQVQQTPFDIEFTLFGIPARVHPLFWLIAIVFGWGLGDPALIVVWVLCLFLSILIHEMGHALLARAFGMSPHIVLHHMGGYAAFHPGRDYTRWKSMAVSFAGPLAGFVFYGLLQVIQIGLYMAEIEVTRPVGLAFMFLEYINLFWGLVNLLPVLPLDGGQICRDGLSLIRGVDGELWALRIGVLVGFAAAALFMQLGMQYAAIMFGMLGLFNLSALGGRQQRW